MKRLIVTIFFLCFAAIYAQPNEKPYVVLVSLDGFRWDYPKYFDTPNLDAIAQKGVKAKSMKPSYPSKTFPNHYSIVTGLYPDHHGIVNNSFYDPLTKKSFALSTPSKKDSEFYGGNPLWNLAEQQGIKSACYFWPGSDTGKKSPSIFKEYDASIPYETRINTVLDWLQLPETERPHFITLYFDEPDHTGHTYGPLSKENEKIIPKMDSIIGELSKKLDALPIGKKINLIVVSDHGMTNISDDKKIVILDYLKPNWYGYAQIINPIMSIQAKNGYNDSIISALKKVPNIRFWRNNKVPKKFHYGSNPRTLDFVVEAKKGYSFVHKKSQKIKGGTHGYNNNMKDMHAIFYAKGPNFKIDKEVSTFQNVSVYPLIAHILGLNYGNIDGDFKEVKGLLKN